MARRFGRKMVVYRRLYAEVAGLFFVELNVGREHYVVNEERIEGQSTVF